MCRLEPDMSIRRGLKVFSPSVFPNECNKKHIAIGIIHAYTKNISKFATVKRKVIGIIENCETSLKSTNFGLARRRSTDFFTGVHACLVTESISNPHIRKRDVLISAEFRSWDDLA